MLNKERKVNNPEKANKITLLISTNIRLKKNITDGKKLWKLPAKRQSLKKGDNFRMRKETNVKRQLKSGTEKVT